LSHNEYLLYLLSLVVRLTSIDTTNDLAPLGQLPRDSFEGQLLTRRP
jgi:hypothetical protein